MEMQGQLVWNLCGGTTPKTAGVGLSILFPGFFLTFAFFVSANSNLLKLSELFDTHQDQLIRKAITIL